MQYRSEEIKELTTALCKAQSEMEIAELNKANPYFKSRYADFQSVVDASRRCLAKYGFSVTQPITTEEDGNAYLNTILMHSSGQWVASKMRINPAKNDIQSISSHITYLRRICYASLIGVVTGEDDDDGEAAVAPTRNPEYKKPTGYITQEQLEQLHFELEGHPDLCERLLKSYNINSLAEIEKSNFIPLIKRIQDIKQKMSTTTNT